MVQCSTAHMHHGRCKDESDITEKTGHDNVNKECGNCLIACMI